MIDWGLALQIAVPIVTLLLGALLTVKLERRPRIVVHYGHISSIRVKRDEGENEYVHTHTVVVRNSGRKTARKVCLTHRVLPESFQLSPSVDYETRELPDGSKNIVIKKLVPGEEVTASYLYFAPLTYNDVNTRVSSDEGLAKVIPVGLTRIYPKWVLNVFRVLVFVGIVATLYLTFILLRMALEWAGVWGA